MQGLTSMTRGERKGRVTSFSSRLEMAVEGLWPRAILEPNTERVCQRLPYQEQLLLLLTKCTAFVAKRAAWMISTGREFSRTAPHLLGLQTYCSLLPFPSPMALNDLMQNELHKRNVSYITSLSYAVGGVLIKPSLGHQTLCFLWHLNNIMINCIPLWLQLLLCWLCWV